MDSIHFLLNALVEKAGYDNGFENSRHLENGGIALSSSRHPACLHVFNVPEGYNVVLDQAPESLHHELQREFGSFFGESFLCENEAELHLFLRRAAALSRALPNQAVNDYLHEIGKELATLPENLKGTEVERMVRQRVGQDKYRDAMLDYWGNACAVTGISIPELLRASHAIPWANCHTDAERLDVFNGLLLSAHLDALFDRFLIGFDCQGKIVFAPSLDIRQLVAIGITPDLCLRWIDERHERYLGWHRQKLNGSDVKNGLIDEIS